MKNFIGKAHKNYVPRPFLLTFSAEQCLKIQVIFYKIKLIFIKIQPIFYKIQV